MNQVRISSIWTEYLIVKLMYIIFVKCSTGTGRTGTFIAIDTILDQMDNKEHIDVFEVVQNLLLQRVNMVDDLVRNKMKNVSVSCLWSVLFC